jgi:ribosomal-protein-serine acetyltransferase
MPDAAFFSNAETSSSFLPGLETSSSPLPKYLRCRGRSLGTCFDEILPDSKRGHKEFVLLGPPLSGRHRQTRMQTRLSARSSGFVESVASSGGSDSGLRQVTPRIKTEIPSLKLRLVKEDDTEELSLRVDQNREHLRRWASWVDGTTTTADTLKFVQFCLNSAVAGTGFHYALQLDGQIVGLVTFNTIEKINRCATMGYWLAKSQTGRGLMTMAAKTLISEGFRQLELNRIQATVATENFPSQAVCDRLGLKKEGILRQAEWVNDHFVDLTMNSVLRSEWMARHKGK